VRAFTGGSSTRLKSEGLAGGFVSSEGFGFGVIGRSTHGFGGGVLGFLYCDSAVNDKSHLLGAHIPTSTRHAAMNCFALQFPYQLIETNSNGIDRLTFHNYLKNEKIPYLFTELYSE